MSVLLRYELYSSGWARCDLRIGDASCSMNASYLSNALDDLAILAIAVMHGYAPVKCTFAEEPGEYRWIVDRVPHDAVRIRVRVLEFADTFSREPDERGQVLFDQECRLRTFGAVLSELQRIYREYGEAKYLEMWHNHPFPTDRLFELEALMRGRLPGNR